jgi:hypothetical protein
MSFVIYREQLKILDSIYKDRFLKKIIPLLRSFFKEKLSSKTDEDLLTRLKEDYIVANNLDIKSERGITRFICLGYILDRNFYDRPEFQELFNNEEINKDKYINLIFEEAKVNSKKPLRSDDQKAVGENDYYLKDLVQKLATLIQ